MTTSHSQMLSGIGGKNGRGNFTRNKYYLIVFQQVRGLLSFLMDGRPSIS